jgi:hypothetical protein
VNLRQQTDQRSSVNKDEKFAETLSRVRPAEEPEQSPAQCDEQIPNVGERERRPILEQNVTDSFARRQIQCVEYAFPKDE